MASGDGEETGTEHRLGGPGPFRTDRLEHSTQGRGGDPGPVGESLTRVQEFRYGRNSLLSPCFVRRPGDASQVRARRSSTRGEGIGPPTTPTKRTGGNGRCRTRPRGGTPARTRNSRPPPRIAATPPRPPPANNSVKWATSIARWRGTSKIVATARAVESAPAALIPNPCPTGIWCVRRSVTRPEFGGTSRRATASEMGSGPGDVSLDAHDVPVARLPPRVRGDPELEHDPGSGGARPRGSRAARSGEKNPVTCPGANAIPRHDRTVALRLVTRGSKLDYL